MIMKVLYCLAVLSAVVCTTVGGVCLYQLNQKEIYCLTAFGFGIGLFMLLISFHLFACFVDWIEGSPITLNIFDFTLNPLASSQQPSSLPNVPSKIQEIRIQA
jgi:hypothetical protein